MKRIHQGKFKPKNPNKYKGNPDNIWYRSGLEFRFYTWLDMKPFVLEWNSEEIAIPYVSPKDQKIHRYFPDAWAKIQTKNGAKCYLIEIKPFSQCCLPPKPKRQTKRYLNEIVTFAINDAKWEAAKSFCDQQGWDWKIITEKDLFGSKR